MDEAMVKESAESRFETGQGPTSRTKKRRGLPDGKRPPKELGASHVLRERTVLEAGKDVTPS
jgi:hypothetical protein